jgi:hypothetical protein
MALNSSSYESMHQDHGSEPTRKHSSAPAILLFLAFALIVALAVPNVRARLSKVFPSATPKRVNMGLRVWASKEAGNYYCPGSEFSGRGSGTYLKQGDALTLGYQPALGKYCQQGESTDSKSIARSTRRQPRYAGAPSNSSTGSEDSR